MKQLPKQSKKLSPTIIGDNGPKTAPYRIWDTVVPQLFIRIQPSGVKSWNVQWTRTSSKALGKWPGVTVESARTKAKALLVETDQHGAPLAVIEASKPEPAKPITLGGFLTDKYEPWCLANRKAGKANLRVMRHAFADMLDTPLIEIGAGDVEEWRTDRVNAGMSKATASRDISRLKGALSRAVDWGDLPAQPLKSVKLERLKKNQGPGRYLSAAETTRLRKALVARDAKARKARESGNKWRLAREVEPLPIIPANGFSDYLTPLVLVAMNTGCRRGELTQITWRDIDFGESVLTIQAGYAKSEEARSIPLNAEAVATLKQWKKQSGSSPKVFDVGDPKKAWGTLLTAAKITGFRFHDLRHDFASRLVTAGVDLNTVRDLMGHADLTMTLRYAKLAPKHKADAVAKLGSL